MHRNARTVIAAGQALGLDVEPQEFAEGTRTAAEAAEAIGVALGQIVKSLVFAVDAELVMALVSGDNMLDETLLAAVAGGNRCTRVDAEQVRAATGFPVGGVAPFGHTTPLRVFVDEDLLRFEEVWAAAGTPHLNFPVAPTELVRATGGVVCRIARS